MNKMPRAILPIILTLGLLVTGCQSLSEPPDETSPTMPDETSPTAPAEGTQVGDLAPDFQLQNLDGQVISFSDLRGKPVLLNFWATWCSPCRAEMPHIQQIYEEWSDRGLMLLAVDIGESSSIVKEFVQSNGLSFSVLLDTKKDVAQSYGIQGIPTTFFIDKDGVIQGLRLGAFQNKEQIEQYLGKIISE